MEYRVLGDSGLKVSVIGFGAWGIGGAPFWTNEGHTSSARAIMKSYELGINFFDTAPVYGFGHSEEILGKTLKPVRDKVIYATKCGLRWEIHGSQGMICHDQERLNEIKLYTRSDDPRQEGFKTILSGPAQPPYDAFLPNAGHSLGYIDVKVCELKQLLDAIETGKAVWPNFSDGLKIERVMDAIDRSALSDQWLDV